MTSTKVQLGRGAGDGSGLYSAEGPADHATFVHLLLIDDHALFREGLKFLLRGLEADLAIDEAGSVDAAAARRETAYDLVLLDLNLPGVGHLEALASIREAFPQAPVVVLSGEDDPRMIRATIEHGAMGFVPKSSTPEILIQALRLILARGVYLPVSALASDDGPATVATAPGDPEALMRTLSPRQIEVLRCVIRGQPNKLIARTLDLSESTVKAHLSAVLRTLGARNRTEAVYAAAKLGLRVV
jgi:DNA-binding NarL/FixJ family response regulator